MEPTRSAAPAPDDEERVPIFGTWNRIYAAVILCEIATVGLIAIFSSFPF